MQLSVRASYRSHRFAVPPPGTPTGNARMSRRSWYVTQSTIAIRHTY